MGAPRLFGSKRKETDLSRPEWLALAGSVGVGFGGLLPGSAGSSDPLTLLAWLALVAPAAGFACGAAGVRLWPFGLAVPGVWTCVLVLADAGSARDLTAPQWGAAAVGGLFAAGLGLGALAPRRLWTGVGALLLLALLTAGLSVQGGLAERDASWGATHPRLAAFAIDLSPLTLVLESAGSDWTHSNALMYRASGVEWFARRPYRGARAGPIVLLVGVAIGLFAPRLRRARPDRAPAP